jgi:hypothetical protein
MLLMYIWSSITMQTKKVGNYCQMIKMSQYSRIDDDSIRMLDLPIHISKVSIHASILPFNQI